MRRGLAGNSRKLINNELPDGGAELDFEPEYLYRVFYRIDDDVVTDIRVLHRGQM